MQRGFFSHGLLLILVSVMVGVQLFIILSILLPAVVPGEINGLQITLFLLAYILVAACYEIIQRTLTSYRFDKLAKKSIHTTEKHTLDVTAKALAEKLAIDTPLLYICDDTLDKKHGYNAVILPRWRGFVLSISQNIIHALTPDELEGVIAHEYAHITLGHVTVMSWMNSLLQVSLLLPARGICFVLSPLLKRMHFERTALDACCALFLVTHAGLLLLTVNAISRKFEKQADALAVDSTSSESLLNALRSLDTRFNETGQRFSAEDSESRFQAWQRLTQFFQSHPTVQSRIALLQAKDLI